MFGSTARGEAGAESDLDIGVVYRDPVATDHARLALVLAARVGQAAGRDAVDVVDLEAQGPVFCHRVLCEGWRLYEADAARRIDFESETMLLAAAESDGND